MNDTNEITRLQDLLFMRGEMNNPPCFCCGYNGPGYYQPEQHPCAERHHRLYYKPVVMMARSIPTKKRKWKVNL